MSKALVIIIVVLALIAGLYYFNKKSIVPTPTSPVQQMQSGLQNDNDLMTVSNDLDSTDVDSSIDQGLTQNDADAAVF